MGRILDGIADHMKEYDEQYTFPAADTPEPDMGAVVAALTESGAQIFLNYMPVGAEAAIRFYADCALEAGVAFINNMPVFVASDPGWASRFERKGLPLIGNDIKSQIGATITHRVLTDLFLKRGVKLGRPKGPGKSKLDPHKDEIMALLRTGVPKKLVANKYGTAIVNLYNWILKNNLDVAVRM
jgi:myo-inositol-1-phosphate synthase